VGNLTSWVTNTFSRKTVLHGDRESVSQLVTLFKNLLFTLSSPVKKKSVVVNTVILRNLGWNLTHLVKFYVWQTCKETEECSQGTVELNWKTYERRGSLETIGVILLLLMKLFVVKSSLLVLLNGFYSLLPPYVTSEVIKVYKCISIFFLALFCSRKVGFQFHNMEIL